MRADLTCLAIVSALILVVAADGRSVSGAGLRLVAFTPPLAPGGIRKSSNYISLPKEEDGKSGTDSLTRLGLFSGLFGGDKDKKQQEQPKQSGASSAAPKKASGGGPCPKCNDVKAIACPGCAGTGKNKKTGNVLERWKCVECQGFGFVVCPTCSGASKGLTPEQTGER